MFKAKISALLPLLAAKEEEKSDGVFMLTLMMSLLPLTLLMMAMKLLDFRGGAELERLICVLICKLDAAHLKESEEVVLSQLKVLKSHRLVLGHFEFSQCLPVLFDQLLGLTLLGTENVTSDNVQLLSHFGDLLSLLLDLGPFLFLNGLFNDWELFQSFLNLLNVLVIRNKGRVLRSTSDIGHQAGRRGSHQTRHHIPSGNVKGWLRRLKRVGVARSLRGDITLGCLSTNIASRGYSRLRREACWAEGEADERGCHDKYARRNVATRTLSEGMQLDTLSVC
mmetsp:Transcript_15425/g.25498  ORF Transcript_15425/g.25498 Transcript_15425/m.25498 type:complete len:281 (+) Transcript_15425:315-1157(+)